MTEPEKHDLKHKTAPDAPELPKDHTPQSPSKLTRTFAKLSRPLAAVFVIVALSLVGYFGFLRSSADTYDLAFRFDRQSVDCAKKLTNAECKAKRDNAEAAALATFQKHCNAMDRNYNANNQACRQCKAGFAENANGKCKQLVPKNCAAENRKQDTPYECGGCVAQYSPNSNGVCKRDVDCSAQNRKQETKLTCGPCKSGFAEGGAGNCRQLIDCPKEQNRKQDNRFSCGNCIANYSPNANGVCKKDQPKDTGTKNTNPSKAAQVACEAKGQVYKNGICTSTCASGFTKKNGACVASTTGIKGGSVADAQCAAGQTKTAAGRCAVVSKKPTCDAQHKVYNAADNSCRQKCVAGYYLSSTACLPVAKPKEDPAVKQACAAAHQTYDVKTNACQKSCVKGYYLKDKVCAKIPAKVSDCNRDVTGRCSADVKDVKEICKGQHREYNANKNTCRSTCVDGYYKEAGVCNKVGDGKPKVVQKRCGDQNLTYDADANLCKPNCKADYVMRDGACIPWEDASMTKSRCAALGRVWQIAIPAATLEDGTTVPAVAAKCAMVCSNPATTIANVDTPDTAYCKAQKDAKGVNVVSTTITKEQCKKQNRAWIEAINACSARCKSGFFIENGKCVEVKPAEAPSLLGTGDAGNGTTDGCKSDQQLVAKPVRGKTTNDPRVAVCPDDQATTKPTPASDGKSVKHEVETTLTKQACALLGRAWVPATKVDGKKVAGGCSLQQCRNAGVDARESNGSAYCEDSVARISKEKCQQLHRQWTPIVSGCLIHPDQKRTKPQVNSARCAAPYTVYIFHTAAQGMDECVKPTTYENLKSVAKSVGRPVAAVAGMPAQALCKLRPGMQWVDGRCVVKRVPAATTASSTSGGSKSSGCPSGQRNLDGTCKASSSYGDDHRTPLNSGKSKDKPTTSYGDEHRSPTGTQSKCAGYFDIRGKCDKTYYQYATQSEWDKFR